jgi:hypothetical protein
VIIEIGGDKETTSTDQGSGPPALMSELGQKRTWWGEFAMPALPPKADIRRRYHDVPFVPEADMAL